VCVLEQGGAWDSHLLLIEFTYNNSYHSSIAMAPFEALYVGGAGLLCVGLSREKVWCWDQS